MEHKEMHSDEWQKRSMEISKNGQLDEMVESELYDLTWRISTEFIINTLGVKGSENIFDAGFGWGRIMHGLKHYHPELKIEGVELTDELCERARGLMKEAKAEGVKLLKGDLLDLKDFSSDSFDAVYSTRVLHYITDKKKVLQNFQRIIKPDGKILIIIPNMYCPYRWLSYGHPLYPIRKLRDRLKEVGFRDLSWGSIGFIPPFVGRRHYKSNLFLVEVMSRKIPGINIMGGLSYVVGTKV